MLNFHCYEISCRTASSMQHVSAWISSYCCHHILKGFSLSCQFSFLSRTKAEPPSPSPATPNLLPSLLFRFSGEFSTQNKVHLTVTQKITAGRIDPCIHKEPAFQFEVPKRSVILKCEAEVVCCEWRQRRHYKEKGATAESLNVWTEGDGSWLWNVWHGMLVS